MKQTFRYSPLALLISLGLTLPSGTAASGPAAQTADPIDRLLAAMTLDDKISMLHGVTDPQSLGQAGYLPGVPRLGIPPLRLSDGPAGVRTSRPATALPAPVALAATFSPELAQAYGQVIGRDGRLRGQNVLLAPMVNIVRVPQAGRNFETLGEDPLLAARMVAAEISGIQSEGVIATVKHFAQNNQENQRQSVSADVDERTLHEIELPGFEAAVRAGVGSVMAAYNKVNGTYAAEHPLLLNEILRGLWKFDGWVMSDWGATHSAGSALLAGLDMEMPSGRYFGTLADALKTGEITAAAIDVAVRRILAPMQRAGLLGGAPRAAAAGDVPASTPIAREIAIAGAVLLRNENNLLPLSTEDLASLAVIGPTARTLLVGGGGSARVVPMQVESPYAALGRRAGPRAGLQYAVGYDLDGVVVPESALAPADLPSSLPPGGTLTWSGTLTAPITGDYELKVQTLGGRASIQLDQPAATTSTAGGRGGRGGGRGGSGTLLTTADGLTNSTVPARFEAGSTHSITVSATAGASTPMQLRLAWVVPGWRDAKIEEAARLAKSARAAVVFAYDEGTEGRDRISLSLPGPQDALIHAVAAANPRTVVVLNNEAPVVMPWAAEVGAILQMWYPGQEGADAEASVLVGAADPGGRLPVTFPRRVEDSPTHPPERYPGVDGRGAYSEGIFVGYRWYDAQRLEPLFAFGHGLSYTTFEYSGLDVAAKSDGYDVSFQIKNTGRREGVAVPQVYLGPPPAAPVPMAQQSLAGFQRIVLPAGLAQRVTIHIDARARSYWSVARHDWVLATGRRAIVVGASSRDTRLRGEIQ